MRGGVIVSVGDWEIEIFACHRGIFGVKGSGRCGILLCYYFKSWEVFL